MIYKKAIPGGVLLSVRPFSEPNKNAACEIMAKVTSSQGTRRDAHIYICNLNNLMTLSDTSILMTALRALADAAQKQMGKVQEQAAQARLKRRKKK